MIKKILFLVLLFRTIIFSKEIKFFGITEEEKKKLEKSI